MQMTLMERMKQLEVLTLIHVNPDLSKLTELAKEVPVELAEELASEAREIGQPQRAASICLGLAAIGKLDHAFLTKLLS